MRGTPWILAAMAMFGCAPAPVQGDPGAAASAADPALAGGGAGGPEGGAASDGGPAKARPPPPDRYCDPALDAAAGLTIADTGACPGLMPAPPDCAADVALCAGWNPSGPGGIFASGATSDAQGAVALSCTSYDSGATSYRLGLASAKYAVSARIGEGVAPLQSGFVGMPVSRPAPLLFFSHDGAQLSSTTANLAQVMAVPGGAMIVTAQPAAGGTDVLAQLFGKDGAPLAPPRLLAHLGSASVGLGGAADLDGNVLVTWSSYDRFAAQAQWLAPDGGLLSPAFDVSSWAGHASMVAALAGGGVAVADSAGAPWLGVLAAGSQSAAPAPAWLSSRGPFRLVRGGAAMLFGGSEVVAAGGASCGTLTFPDRGRVEVGADGTLFHASADGKAFRIYPQLLR